jgi:hypothetical protein
MSVVGITIELSTKVGNQIKQRKQMSNATLTVGSQFTTAKSKVSGIVEEIVKNPSGSTRVKLNVNGQARWTTVK